ncbi:hypothetical protein M2322_004299 [Rhodoblastus acidophilus]|uniref:hypothetical protein n=1 Tax=Rhodoblastus acidophilus TaxID=1074 RepID=UPI0022246058|nr:hypothetical protein [Rhodoblastus acidophilus]MCW2318730.1 hypothetical protein [Rhodoblastus acidophilus]
MAFSPPCELRAGRGSQPSSSRSVAARIAMTAAAFMVGPAPAQSEDIPSWLASKPVSKNRAQSGAPKAGTNADMRAGAGDDRIDTEHIFGFSMGSDIGEKGEIEFEMENVGGVGKRSGSYFAFTSLNLLKYTVTDNFRIAPGVAWGANSIRNVPGYDSRSQGALKGAVVELRYKLLDRDAMPFGLTLHAQPGWDRVDETTALRVEGYGGEFALLADKEIIKDRLWTAVNLWYGLAASKDAGGGDAWSRGSDLELHGAVSTRVSRTLVMGGEMRYLRAYDGMGLNTFRGEALFLGPTFSWTVARNVGLSGTVNFQVAGKAAGAAHSLDLDNYERVQGMLRFNMHF